MGFLHVGAGRCAAGTVNFSRQPQHSHGFLFLSAPFSSQASKSSLRRAESQVHTAHNVTTTDGSDCSLCVEITEYLQVLQGCNPFCQKIPFM